MELLCFLLTLMLVTFLGAKIFFWYQANKITEDTPATLQALNDPVDKPLIVLNTKGDAITHRHLQASLLCTGRPGSGKTTGLGAAVATGALSLGGPGLWLCVKEDEAQNARKICKAAGREKDILMFSPRAEETHRFNPLQYTYEYCLKEKIGIKPVVELLKIASELGNDGQKNQHSDFWQQSSEIMAEHLIEVLGTALGRIRISDVVSFLDSAPESKKQVAKSLKWSTSFTAKVLTKAHANAQRMTSASRRQDVEQAISYWVERYPAMNERTRSDILSTFSTWARHFQSGVIRDTFATNSTFSPETIFKNNSICICDWPVKRFGIVGTLSQALVKQCFQSFAMRKPADKPMYFHQDEFQAFVSTADREFIETARSKNNLVFAATQNKDSLLSALGGRQNEATAESLIGLFGTLAFCANNHEPTNRYMADCIGKDYVDVSGVATGDLLSVDTREDYRYQVEPIEATRLKTGGPKHSFETEVIFFRSGEPFHNGKNFLKAVIPQTRLY